MKLQNQKFIYFLFFTGNTINNTVFINLKYNI